MTDEIEPARNTGNAGKGRQRGVPNKITTAAKEAFQRAFDEIGGAEALAAWAILNQTEFYKLFARLIPVESHVSGANGGPVEVAWPLPKTSLDL